jgi:tellurite methyltransferase
VKGWHERIRTIKLVDHAQSRVDADALRELAEEMRRRGLSIAMRLVDLEGGSGVLPADAFDAIVVVHYLHRPLFPQLLAALRPGGVLIYETFTTAQAARGKPTNPDFLLQPGELRDLVGSLDVLAWREGEFDGRDVASVVAQKPRDVVAAQKPRDVIARKP